MPTLLFTVSPAAVGQLHDILACLAKFHEDISLEATPSELRISSLNSSKTAYASFNLVSNTFFEKYHFSPDRRDNSAPKIWACKLQNKALASVFRRRLSDGKEKDTALERSEFELQARADLPECRIIIRLICRFGVVKTYRLTYETGEILHASFDKSGSLNRWSVSAKTLQDVVEYFGPKTEHLDWFLQDGKVTFTSYTEKVQNGREILKQPMHTSVALEKRDFDECSLEEGLHIGIVVKDFRAIVAHAETLQAEVKAQYSVGGRPMQISYVTNGIISEYTLMTRGTSQAPSGSAIPVPARDLSVRPRTQPQPQPQPQSHRMSSTARAETETPMAPPAPRHLDRLATDSERNTPAPGDSPPQPSAHMNPDSLFIPADDDDDRWDEPNYEDDGDLVTWDNATDTIHPSASTRRIRDSEPTSFINAPERPIDRVNEIAPTQRLSQVKGLFD